MTAVTAHCVWNFNSRPIVHLVTVLQFLRSITTVFPICMQYDTSIVIIYCTLIICYFLQILPKYCAYKSLRSWTGLVKIWWSWSWSRRPWSWSCLGQFVKVLVSSPEGSGLGLGLGLEKKVLALVLRKSSQVVTSLPLLLPLLPLQYYTILMFDFSFWFILYV